MANPFSKDAGLMIVDALRDAPKYSLDIIKMLNGRLSRATIYLTISRLEEGGLIVSEAPDRRRRGEISRPLYKLTKAGEEFRLEASRRRTPEKTANTTARELLLPGVSGRPRSG